MFVEHSSAELFLITFMSDSSARDSEHILKYT